MSDEFGTNSLPHITVGGPLNCQSLLAAHELVPRVQRRQRRAINGDRPRQQPFGCAPACARVGFAACVADRDPRVDRLQIGGPLGVARRRRRAVQAGRTIERGWVRGSASSASTSTSAPDIGLAGGQVQARRDGERLPVPERVEVLRDEVAQWLCTTPRPGAAPRGIGGGARGSTRTCPQRWRRPRPRATGPTRGEPAIER